MRRRTEGPGIRLIAIDLDGTLLNSDRKIAPVTAAAIDRAASRGVRVILATGRRYHAANPFISALTLPGPHIVNDGALIVAAQGQPLWSRGISPRGARRALRVARTAGYSAVIYRHRLDGPDVFYQDEPELPTFREYLASEGDRVRRVPDLLGFCDFPPEKISIACPDEAAPGLRVALEAAAKGSYHLTVTAAPGGFKYVQVVAATCSKGRALRRLALMCGIARSEVAAIGDEENDLSMLEFAGVGVAMGNARDEVKHRARLVTGTNDDHGVAAALERLLCPGGTVHAGEGVSSG